MSRYMLIASTALMVSRCRVVKSDDKPRTTHSPAAVATWKFGVIGIEHAKTVLELGGSSVDAVVAGIKAVELDERDQYFVGVGGLPNSEGVMELDAAIMDSRRRYGAVMSLQSISTPIVAARLVMDKSEHNVFAGQGALDFALEQGMKKSPVLTEKAYAEWLAWRKGQDSTPSPHDTIGMICLDTEGRLAAGTSTSGWKFKHPGRVGDSPLVGCGLYCDGNHGAAVATGDGEEIMRTCLSFLVVELIRQVIVPYLDICNLW
jgi:N4-(beta-N-acetylglucosaminyl)-L-asparaginase